MVPVEFFVLPRNGRVAALYPALENAPAKVIMPLNEGDNPISSVLQEFFPSREIPYAYVTCSMRRKDFENFFNTRLGYQQSLFNDAVGGGWVPLRRIEVPASLDALVALPSAHLAGYQDVPSGHVVPEPVRPRC